MKNIVTIGGGTGTFTILSALKNYPVHLTAIVSMSDDGGSTGVLRDDYGVLPPGDIRRALVALSSSSETMRDLFNYRFENGSLGGHAFGNLFLSALEKVTGNFTRALQETSEILNIKGEVVPVTLDDVRLYAKLKDGKIIKGESNIDIPKAPRRSPIEEIWLRPAARINPQVRDVLKKADLIVLCPGDLYTSIVPNLLVQGMKAELKKSKAKKVFICNLMTKSGETDGYAAEDFLRTIEKYIGEDVLHYAVFNNKRPAERILWRYRREYSEFVEPPVAKSHKKTKYILANLIGLHSGKFIRHDTNKKLPEILLSMLKK